MEISILGQNMRIEIIELCLIIGGFIALNMFCSCSGGIQEGFNVGTELIGSALNYSMGEGVKGSWEKTVNKNITYNDWYKPFENNTGGKVPLPEGQMLIFDDNKFDPGCCPATYSNSMGCVCATTEQMEYLNERGGNRTHQTEF